MPMYDPDQALSSVRREFGEHGGVAPSVCRSATFTVMDPATLPDIFSGSKGPDKGGCFLYSRHFNPTVDALSRYMAVIEGTEAAMCTASGMSAIACSLLQRCKVGDHIVASNTVYGGTHALLSRLFQEMNISTTLVDPGDPTNFKQAVRPETKVFYAETIANPTLKICDIEALAQIAHQHHITLIIDNTFSPLMISPAQLGADIVVYSMTKFVNGASDLIAGAICASKAFIYELMDVHTGRIVLLGPTMDPRVAFDILQRLPHLALRMQEHSRRAQAIAEKLVDLGMDVVYPGLPHFAQHGLIKSMLNQGYGFGGMLTIDCHTKENAESLMGILQNQEQFGLIAVSLGYFDTLMSCSGSTTSSEISLKDQAKMGLSPGLLRISVGITGNLEERLEQVERGVRAAGLI